MIKTCIFGHSPEEVPAGTDALRYQIWLCLLIDEQIKMGRRKYVSGACPGVDLWCMAYIADLKRSNQSLELHVFTENKQVPMDEYSLKLKRATLLTADSVTVVNDYNEKISGMIDLASALLSVDYPSGRTGYLPYAKKNKLQLTLLSPRDLERNAFAKPG